MIKKVLRLSLIDCLVLVFFIFSGTAKAEGVRLSLGLYSKVRALSPVQLQFSAEKFNSVVIGQWDDDIEKASDLKLYNPEIKIFGYVNSNHVIIDSPRYQECQQNEQIFAHDVSGNRIESLDFGQILTDIHNPDWTGKIIHWANELPSYVDGIFLDVAQPTLNQSNYKNMPKGYDPYQHTIAMKEFFHNVNQGYSGMVVINGLKDGVKSNNYMDEVDGGLVEGFMFSKLRQNVDPGILQKHVDALIEAGKKGLKASACTKGYKENIDNRIFALACYFLGANDLSTYSFVDIDNEFSNPLQYYPEYKIDLGSPMGKPDKVASLLDPETNLTIRLFEKGMVIVNPWSNDIDIQLDGEYRKIIPYGGGVVGTDGTYDGHLDYENKSEFATVPRSSAMILLAVGKPPSPPENLHVLDK